MTGEEKLRFFHRNWSQLVFLWTVRLCDHPDIKICVRIFSCVTQKAMLHVNLSPNIMQYPSQGICRHQVPNVFMSFWNSKRENWLKLMYAKNKLFGKVYMYIVTYACKIPPVNISKNLFGEKCQLFFLRVYCTKWPNILNKLEY